MQSPALEARRLTKRFGAVVACGAVELTVHPGQIHALLRDPDVFILDEPTSVLTAAESTELFAVLRRVVRDEHRAVLLISHKLDEVLHATDRVSIMRSGRVVAERPTAETSAAELAREM